MSKERQKKLLTKSLATAKKQIESEIEYTEDLIVATEELKKTFKKIGRDTDYLDRKIERKTEKLNELKNNLKELEK